MKRIFAALECYQRFQAQRIRELDGFAIPFLEDFDEALMAIEMTLVDPPYLLDFGKVHIDAPPPYHGDPQLLANAFAEWRERFGSDWQDVAFVLKTLEKRFGIFYADPRPSNICTGNIDDSDDWMLDENPPPADQDWRGTE